MIGVHHGDTLRHGTQEGLGHTPVNRNSVSLLPCPDTIITVFRSNVDTSIAGAGRALLQALSIISWIFASVFFFWFLPLMTSIMLMHLQYFIWPAMPCSQTDSFLAIPEITILSFLPEKFSIAGIDLFLVSLYPMW